MNNVWQIRRSADSDGGDIERAAGTGCGERPGKVPETYERAEWSVPHRGGI